MNQLTLQCNIQLFKAGKLMCMAGTLYVPISVCVCVCVCACVCVPLQLSHVLSYVIRLLCYSAVEATGSLQAQ